MTENKFTFTLFDSTASASGQKHRTHGNLIREAQCIRRMGASGKDVRVVLASESSVKGGGIRLQDTQQRVRFRQMIKSASRPPKLPGFAIAGEGLVHCGTGAEVEEVRRRPDTALRLGDRMRSRIAASILSACLFTFLSETCTVFLTKSMSKPIYYRDMGRPNSQKLRSEVRAKPDSSSTRLRRFQKSQARPSLAEIPYLAFRWCRDSEGGSRRLVRRAAHGCGRIEESPLRAICGAGCGRGGMSC